MEDRDFQRELKMIASSGVGTGQGERELTKEVMRRHRRRRLIGSLTAVGGVALVVLFVATALLDSGLDQGSTIAAAPTPCLEVSSPEHESAECEPTTPIPTPSSVAQAGDVIFVFFQEDGSNTYNKGSYQSRPRPVGASASTAGRLRAALNELVKGPTAVERQSGVGSIFSAKTAGIVRQVELDDSGTATINFAPFAEKIPAVSAADGGAHFIFSLNETIFQFEAVQSIDYRVNGTCEAFWTPMEAECHLYTRAEWEQTG